MKNRTPLLIVILVISILSIVLSSFFAWNNSDNGGITFPMHNEGIILWYLSDHSLQEELKEPYLNDAQIEKITDKDLEQVPEIKRLINAALQEEFPLNETGRILSDIETLKEYHRYYATILAEKYSKEPEEFIRILPARQGDLEISPNAYNYEFDGSSFEYEGEQYGWEHSSFVDYEIENLADIGVYKHKHLLDPKRHIWATITDEQMQEHMPLLRDAVNRIGTMQENIEVQNSMSRSDLDRYQKWYEQNVPHGIFQYDERYFKIGFWIA